MSFHELVFHVNIGWSHQFLACYKRWTIQFGVWNVWIVYVRLTGLTYHDPILMLNWSMFSFHCKVRASDILTNIPTIVDVLNYSIMYIFSSSRFTIPWPHVYGSNVRIKVEGYGLFVNTISHRQTIYFHSSLVKSFFQIIYTKAIVV